MIDLKKNYRFRLNVTIVLTDLQIRHVEKLNSLSINTLGWDDGTLTCGKPDKKHAGFYPVQPSSTPTPRKPSICVYYEENAKKQEGI